MIDKLTPEQEAILIEVRDEWLRHGLSTEPADRLAAEEGVREAYKSADLEPPERIYWAASPWAGAVLQACLAAGKGELDQAAALKDADVRSKLSSWSSSLIYGMHNAGFYAQYDAMERIGVTGLEILHGQQKVARSAGWWWAYDDFAVITERPCLLRRDQNGALHAESGMALRYPDGWGLFSWHGRTVPEWVIEAPAIARIAAEPNTEIRRCAIESLGWDRFTAETQLTLVGSCPDPGNPGQEIQLFDVPEELWGSRIRLVLVTNGSTERSGARRRFGLTVPATISNPLEAAAWGFGESADEYSQTVRRT